MANYTVQKISLTVADLIADLQDYPRDMEIRVASGKFQHSDGDEWTLASVYMDDTEKILWIDIEPDKSIKRSAASLGKPVS